MTGMDIDRTSEAQGRSRRHSGLVQLAITLVFVSFFGFAFSQNADDLPINHYYRGFGFFLAGGIAVVSGISNGFARGALPLSLAALLSMYAFYALTGPMLFGRPEDVAIIEYVLLQWITLIFLVHQSVVSKNWSSNDELIPLVKRLVIVCVMVVVVYLVLFPSTVISIGDLGRRMQLGGAAVHPNRLGFVGAIGILIFGLFTNSLRDRLMFVVCVCLVALAGSRIGWLMGVTAILLVLFDKFHATVRLLLGVAMGIAGAGLLSVLIFVDPFLLLDTNDRYWLTLNGRTDVWWTVLRMFDLSPYIGWGFFLGPKNIGAILSQPWWSATNAQSDLLGAIVSGGYIGLGFYLLFVFAMISEAIRIRDRKRRFVMLSVILLYFISSSFEPFFVHNPGVATAIMLVMLLQSQRWNRMPKQLPSNSAPQLEQAHPA
jgi:O-antigen ligase